MSVATLKRDLRQLTSRLDFIESARAAGLTPYTYIDRAGARRLRACAPGEEPPPGAQELLPEK